MKHNEFDNEEKYKLYRNVKDLLHPTISKKNISNYRIIINDDLLPLRVFYPKKVTNMQNVMIYIHGESKITGCDKNYSDISANFAKEFDHLIISIDYDNYNKTLKEVSIKIYDTIKKIYKELISIGINNKNIILVGDSTAATIILNMTKKMNKENIEFGKYILFYPPVSGKYSQTNDNYDASIFKNLSLYYKGQKKDYFPMYQTSISYPETLILCGNVDPLLNEISEFSNKFNLTLKTIQFANHGFLNSKDKEIIEECIREITEFI